MELLGGNLVEKIISPPDIVNPLTVSVQANGEKRLILDLRHINLHVFYKRKFKCENSHTMKNTVFPFDLVRLPSRRQFSRSSQIFGFLVGVCSRPYEIFPVYCFAFWAFQRSLYFRQVQCLSLWRHIGGRKAFQSSYFSMMALVLVHRSKLLS